MMDGYTCCEPFSPGDLVFLFEFEYPEILGQMSERY